MAGTTASQSAAGHSAECQKLNTVADVPLQEPSLQESFTLGHNTQV